jgi:signal transduction histidine kinase
MVVVGYVGVAAALNVILRLWYSFRWFDSVPRFTPGLFSGSVYVGPFSTWTQVLIVVLVLPALMLTGWAWWIAAGGLLRPVSATAQTVRQLGPQNLGQRIRMGGGAGDPLKELADALDTALDRLAAGYEGQRRFAANASHELRTPLAVQRLLTEVALDDPEATQDLRRLGAHLLRANERNERLVEGLLVLAEADRGLPGMVPVRLDELAGSVLGSHQDMAGKHGVALRRKLTERVVPGDPLLLERLLANLVGNAIKYNQPGGWVEVEVTPQHRAALTVSNTGQYVPAEEVSALFEPFRRLTADRTDHGGGAGLGLSIVRSITAAHGGTVRARPRPGGGLIVQIDLPAPSSADDTAHKSAKEAITELRDLARGVHPPILDHGLGSALATLGARSGVPVELVVDLPERASAAIETIGYLCAAELLANVAKHSGARHATLEAVHVPGLLRVRVSDDGVGGARIEARGGLAGLAERLRTVGGRMEISSPSGGPTAVTVELPCHA